MENLTKFVLPGGLFFLTIVVGIWLSNLGKPYNGILFNVHKLIALGAVVLAGIELVQRARVNQTPGLLIGFMVVFGLCALALFISGALMSAGKLDYSLMLTVHRITPIVVLAAAAGLAYLAGIGSPRVNP